MAAFMYSEDGRHSLSYYVLELQRADIANVILSWVQSLIWKRQDFLVMPEGLIRLQPILAVTVVQLTSAASPRLKLDAAALWVKEAILAAA